MASKIFKSILYSEIEKFKRSFSETSIDLFYDAQTKRLIHPGEYGMYKERAVKDFLKMITPQRLSIHTGFVITPKDKVSTQCDIIIYDGSSTPLIQDVQNQTFYPVETVVGIGEIKSTLSRSDLKEAINKLARNKKLRDDISDLKPSIVKRSHPGAIDLQFYMYDHIYTFLICEKLDFNINSLKFSDLYDEDIEQKFRHNMILSLSDGLFLYNDGKYWHYPISPSGNQVEEAIELPVPGREKLHFEAFAHYFFMGIDSATIFYPETRHYIF